MHALSQPSSERSDGVAEHRSLDRLVEEAAEQITRFDPQEAFSASATGGIIIDTRSQDARELHGVIPGSLHIPRTVLEWRASDRTLPASNLQRRRAALDRAA